MKEMEGFGKGLSPSRSTGCEENNENDSSQDNVMNPKFQTHKKTFAKHFMSPTISAASKAAAPRKKILAERSENSTIYDAQSQKMFNSEMRKSPRNSSVSYFSRSPSWLVNNHVSDDDWDANVVANSVKDYDPLTNFLSPRPRYLRFNPNRCREIFDRLEQEGVEDLNSSLDSEEFNDEEGSLEEEIKDSSFTPPRESFINEKNEENNEYGDDYEEEEEEEAELEEERGWCLKVLLKLLFTLIACLLSTSYICSMNSPTPSPTQQAILNVKDGYLMIKKQALEVISTRMYDAGFLEVGVADGYGEFEDDNVVMEDSVEVEVLEHNVECLDGSDHVVGNEKEHCEDETDEIEVARGGELVFEANNFELLVAARTDESDSFCVEEEVESFCPSSNEDNVAKTDAADQDSCGYGLENAFEGPNQLQELEHLVKPVPEVKVDEIKVVRGGELVFEADNVELLVAARTDESDSFCAEEEIEFYYPSSNEDNVAKTDEGDKDSCGFRLENELESSNQLQELEHPVKPIPAEETLQESKGVDETEPLEAIELHEKLTNSVQKVDETGSDNEIVIAVSVVTVVLTSLATVYHSKKARTVPAPESEPHTSAVEEEKALTPVLPPVKRKIEFLSRPPLSHEKEEASGEINHHIGVPHVELIGEIVVGQMSSRKHKMSESEKKTTTFSSRTQPSQLEYSTSNSTSYGSFTTETKILKKEGGQAGEAMVDVTPVRRSSRLRSRSAAMSP